MDFSGNEAAGARKFASLWRPVAACGALWRAVAADWMPLKKPLQAGRPQIIRSSDAGIIGWSDVGDHQWSDLRSSSVWLAATG